MSSSSRRARAVSGRRTLMSRLRRILWRTIRVLILLASAIGPGMPPPPPPPPDPTEQVSDDGATLERE